MDTPSLSRRQRKCLAIFEATIGGAVILAPYA
jgi:hypothetical protein